MADYRAPRDDMDFVLHDVFRVADDWPAKQTKKVLSLKTAR